MDELNGIRDIIADHEAQAKEQPLYDTASPPFYSTDPTCIAIIAKARARGWFFMGDLIKILNLWRISQGFPGNLTSKSNPLAVAYHRSQLKGERADYQATIKVDIESALEYLRQYKPRRREERSK